MRHVRTLAPVALSLLALSTGALAGCSAESPDATSGEEAFSSNQATLLDFEFDAELVTDFSWNDKQTIQDQLLYTIGHLNGNNSVGRLDDLTLSEVKKEDVAFFGTDPGDDVTEGWWDEMLVQWFDVPEEEKPAAPNKEKQA